MDLQTQTPSPEVIVERRKPKPKSKNHGWYAFLLVICVLLAIGYVISTKKLYKPGDDLGYNIGLAGGLMLLTLLLYPLRKRATFMKGFGILPKWFKWHMIFGILGPTLILYHSTFVVRSINAGVALTCMLLVAGSGVFGRFFYTKIHHGLYGRQTSLKELQTEIERSGDVKSTFSFAPGIERSLSEFHAQTLENAGDGRINITNFIMAGIRASLLSRSLTKELKHIMYAKAQTENWNAAQMRQLDKMHREYRGLIHSYLKAVRDVAQFHTYQELFSWWHILHIPLVYMLAFSAIFHVLSVHMY
jgi:hypothetical protein